MVKKGPRLSLVSRLEPFAIFHASSSGLFKKETKSNKRIFQDYTIIYPQLRSKAEKLLNEKNLS